MRKAIRIVTLSLLTVIIASLFGIVPLQFITQLLCFILVMAVYFAVAGLWWLVRRSKAL
jgi:hypothetical protein